MADDLDAIAARYDAPGGDDLDAIAARYDTAVVDEAPQPSKLESGLRGAAQGATFGFADEIAGAWEALTTSKKYAQARDESRRAFAAAKAANPLTYGAGELGGGLATALIPGAGLAGAGARAATMGGRVAANIARGAGAGALSGAGYSEGGTIEQVASDAAKGGLVGGAVGGVAGYLGEKLLRGAQGRVNKRIVDDIGNKATPTQRQALALRSDDVVEAAQAHGLDRVARDPEKLKKAARQALGEEAKVTRPAYEAVNEATGGFKRADAVKALRAAKAQYSGPDQKAMARQIDGLIADVREDWGKRVDVQQVRDMVTRLQSKGYAGNALQPSQAKQLSRDMAGALKGALDDHLRKAAERSPQLAQQVDAVFAANKRIAALATIKQAAAKRETLAGFAPTGLRDIASKGLDAGLLFTGNLPGLVAKKAAERIVPAAIRGGDRALARISSGTGAPAQLAQRLIEAGYPVAGAGLAGGFAPSAPEQVEPY